MQLRVLGCFGGSACDMRPTSFLINDRIAIDAGALTSGLSLREQGEVSHIFFSHSHIDHIFTLPFLLDNNFSKIQKPIEVYGPKHTMDCLRNNLFNDQLWPDFTKISNGQSKLLRLNALKPNETVEVHGIKITPAAMDHTVECFGYLIENNHAASFIFGDTCRVDNALPLIQKASNLKIVVLEASFPDRMAKIAVSSRHLTTQTFCNEVKKFPKNIRVLATHMKPDCLGEIQIEIADLGLDNVSLIEQGAAYELGRPKSKGEN